MFIKLGGGLSQVTRGQFSVAILMATYNGECYLREQLDSILNQSFAGFEVYVRDDGSIDGTTDILDAYALKYPGRIHVLPSGKRLGARGSFSYLMQMCDADYIFFCDQDDVWSAEKVEVSLQSMRRLEEIYGPTPILLHSDLHVVDEKLRLVDSSFWRYQNLDPVKGSSLNKLLVQNVVTGCAMMINRALNKLASPVPSEAVMHDWWVALVAAAFGKIEHLSCQTVLYRQHGNNEKGAKAWTSEFVYKTLARNLMETNDIAESLYATRMQADAIYKHFSNQLQPTTKNVVFAYANLDKHSFIQRRMLLLKHRLFKQGFARNLGLMMFT